MFLMEASVYFLFIKETWINFPSYPLTLMFFHGVKDNIVVDVVGGIGYCWRKHFVSIYSSGLNYSSNRAFLDYLDTEFPLMLWGHKNLGIYFPQSYHISLAN